MTKYEDITSMAASYARAFLKHRSQCIALASHMAELVREFLEAPEDRVLFISLNENMLAVGDPSNNPEVIQGRDGFWYFGLYLHFESGASSAFSSINFCIGIKHIEGVSIVRLGRDFDVDVDDNNSWLPVLQEIERDLHDFYSADLSQRPRKLGFVL